VRTRAAAAAVGIVLSVALAGCTTPEPPEPTPAPLFASEEEAFAAAEKTYRAYVDALNQVDLSDPATFEPVYALTTGDANASDRKSLSEFHADNVTVTGASEVKLLEPIQYSDKSGEVELAACVDVSTVDLLDADGRSMVDPNRPDMQTTTVTLGQGADAPYGLVVSEIAGREVGPQCN
jgi:hypothetical protein